MKSRDLKVLTIEELNEKLEQSVQELYKLRVGATTKELENTAKIPATKRDIARLKQAIGDKKREQSTAAQAAK